MTKAEQTKINTEVCEVYNDLLHCIDMFGSQKIGQLRSCNATVYKTYGYTYLESYGTKIAAIGHGNYQCYDFLRKVYGYTATSNQHIHKFCKDYGAVKINQYRPV